MTTGKGFHSPNHTQVPNDLFDVHMKEMGEAELKVVLHTIRQTLGFHKRSDEISITQYQKATGLSRPTVIKGLAQAVSRGVLAEKTKGKRGIKSYSLVIKVDQSKPADQLKKFTSTSKETLPVDKAATSKKSLPTKEKKEIPQKKGAGAVVSTNAIVDATRPKIFTFYEQTTGNTLTKYMGEEILETCKQYGEDTVQDAMAESARNNARSWNYTKKILERWEREGRYPNTGKIVPIKPKPAPAENEEPDDWGAEHFVREANDGAA